MCADGARVILAPTDDPAHHAPSGNAAKSVTGERR
jgi:hypothetical protein